MRPLAERSLSTTRLAFVLTWLMLAPEMATEGMSSDKAHVSAFFALTITLFLDIMFSGKPEEQ